MTLYSYKAKKLTGEVVSEKLEAKNETEFMRVLKDKGQYVTEFKSNKDILKVLFSKKMSKKELFIFCKQFSVILGAGISICEALFLLSSQTNNKTIKNSLIKIYEEIQRGEDLSDAFGLYPKLYPKLMLDLILVGEQGGILDLILSDLSNHYEKEDKINKKIINALYYPIIVFIITIIVIIFIMAKVVPVFVATLVSLNGKLPIVTSIMIYISAFLNSNLSYIIIISLISIILISLWLHTNHGKTVVDKAKLKVPLIKKIYYKILCARFSRYCSLLLKSGLTITKTLDVIKSTMNNKVVEEKIDGCIENLRKGMSLTISLRRTELFEDLFLSMTSIGEETGKLDDMLSKCAEIYEDQVNRTMEQLTVLLEPAIIIILALLIGTVIMSIILPMFEIMNSIGA